ncbi:MAG: TIGR01212 family radical SAM protein [Clostridiaceae bacterium]|nr:TIGR01212 family radical SAM protein [Clostridiaceae bacterium]
MEDLERYRHLNEYYKEKFGERTLKICVDGGFTCPNRDGKLGFGGCIYCSEKGSGELIINNKNITEQVKYYFTTYRAKRANKFIVYFQNFTNTYDSIKNLKSKYDSALVDDRIIGLDIGTRPDCITEDIAKLLKNYIDKYYVCVELGLQTSNDEIGKKINRGYTSSQFTEAVKILNKYNIDVIVHIMIGLPGETKKDIINTVNFVNSHKIQGIKIHSTYVVENTVLADMYKNGEYEPLDLDDYIETLIDIMTHLNPTFVIHRISGDAPKDILVAPYWNSHKMWILHGFEKRFRARNLWQGKFYQAE